MPKTLTAQQEQERLKNGVKGVWLFEGDFDDYSQSTLTKRFASTPFTLSSQSYDGLIANGGVRFGPIRLKPTGGIAPVTTFELSLRDEEGLSLLQDSYIVASDSFVGYFLFVTGSDADSDRIEIMRGDIEKTTINKNVWRISFKDDTKKSLKQIPTKIIEPVTYPYGFNFGAVIPEYFGNLNDEPDYVDGSVISLAPCRITDKFQVQGTSSLYQKTTTNLYQWYNSANAFGQVLNASFSGKEFTAPDPARKMFLKASRPKVTGADPPNTISDWWKVIDNDPNTNVAIPYVSPTVNNGISVWMSGTSELGVLTSVKVRVDIVTDTTYALIVGRSDDTQLYSGFNITGSQTITLALNDVGGWEGLQNLYVSVIALFNYNSVTVSAISLEIEFDDFIAFNETEPELYQSGEGYEDVTANYKDGSVIDSANSVLRNPVHILEALLRGRFLNNQEEAKIDGASFAAAAALRSDWYFDFAVDQEVSDAFIDKLCFEAGLFLWSMNGKFYCSAMEKTATPTHFFQGGYSTPVLGKISEPNKQQYDLQIDRTPSTQLYNEVALRYAVHPATEKPQKAEIASGQYRIEGNGDTDEFTDQLTDTSATFVTDDVAVGETVYVAGDTEYRIVSVVSETVLDIQAFDGGTTQTNIATDYYIGPNIREDAFISQVNYKYINPLGGNRQKTFLDDGGYISKFIREELTAQKFVEHVLEWFSVTRERIKFSLLHDGINVEIGDYIYFDHPKLMTGKRAFLISTLDGAINDTQTTITVATGQAGFFRVNDYIYIQEANVTAPEAMKVITVDAANDQLTVERNALNTKAGTFSNGKNIYRLQQKWLVTGITPMSPTVPYIKVEAEEVPESYFPTGITSDEVNNYFNATPEERAQSGWATLRNGRVIFNDPNSAISYIS